LSKHAFVTLHLPPPEILTFERILDDFSSIETCEFGKWVRHEIAAKKPAAPPPITAILIELELVFINYSITIEPFSPDAV
jgi:hypothetical protein